MVRAEPRVARAQVTDTLSAVEGLDLTRLADRGQLGAKILICQLDGIPPLGWGRTAPISFARFCYVARELNLVDPSNVDRSGTFPLMLEVGDNWGEWSAAAVGSQLGLKTYLNSSWDHANLVPLTAVRSTFP